MNIFKIILSLIIIMEMLPVLESNAEVNKKTITNEPKTLETQKIKDKSDFPSTYLKPDLTVDVSGCPTSLNPGDVIPASMKIDIGYQSSKKKDKVDVSYDIVLQNSPTCKYPITYTDPLEKDKILLESGRGNVILQMGQTINVLKDKLKWERGTIPMRVTSEKYHLCVYIDTFNKVDESNEENNCICCEVEVAPYVEHKESFY